MVFDAPSASSSPAATAPPSGNPLHVILTRGFARQVLLGRWFTVFASLLVMAASGATYIFGSYSGTLKSSLGYDQRTLTTVSFFKDLGANLGVFSGLINEVTPPWVVLAMGAGMNLFGYLMVYLAVSGRTARPPLWLVCLYFFVGANSQSFANTGALVTGVKNFPESRGVVIGILKGFVGLSGAVYTQLYLALYGGDDAESLILLIAWLPAAVSVVFVHTIRYMPYPRRRGGQETSSDPFFCFLYLSIALACLLLVMIVVQKQVTFSRDAYGLAAMPLLILLLMPLCVVVKQEYKIFRERQLDAALRAADDTPPAITIVDNAAGADASPSSSSALLQMSSAAATDGTTTTKKTEPQQPAPPSSSSCLGSFGKCVCTMFRPPPRGSDYTILQALVSLDMIVLFIATICGVGGTLTAIDNMGQIGESLGYPSKSINTFVSLISIWNYAGRVTAGYASEAVLLRYRLPRPVLLTAVLLLACAGHVLIALGVPQSLYAASVVIGFCFGAQWPLVFAIISEVFGLKYYSTLYNFGGMASPVGSYILNVRVAGRLYDAAAARQHNAGAVVGGKHEKLCLGVECYKKSFLIITAATVAGALVSLVLVWRTWGFYRGDIYARFRDGDGAAGAGKDGRLPVDRRVVGEEEEEEGEEAAANGRKEGVSRED